jgi:hypothetical protein
MHRKLLIITLLLGLALPTLAQQSLPVRVDRWLAIAQMAGQVTFTQGTRSRSAQIGDRLQAVGDGITTGSASTAVLAVDTGIGSVQVSSDTQVRVQAMSIAPNNGRITRLLVPRGQVRLQLRPFTNPGSRMEIETPAGTSGVRGTEFGLNVQPDGKMAIATLEGSVATSAEGETVLVRGGFQNLTLPGESPLPPTPLTNSTELDYRIDRLIENNIRRVRLVGRVDPVNIVRVGDTPQVTDRNGLFSVVLPATSRLHLQVTVITPLGKQQVYELALL